MAALSLFAMAASAAQSDSKPMPHRVFARSRFGIDSLLARPYDSDVPFGASGNRVWATSPQGWGFNEGVQLLYLTNTNAFDIIVVSGDQNYLVDKADYMPSHVHMIGAPGNQMTAAASFTFTTDKVDAPLTRPFKPEKRWTSWSSGHREDNYTVHFGKLRSLLGLDVYFYNDVEQGGGVAPPENMHVQTFRNGDWHDIPIRPFTPKPDRNTLTFQGVAPQRTEAIRLIFRNRGQNLYTGLYGLDPSFSDQAAREQGREGKHTQGARDTHLKVEGDKWITQDDVLVTRTRVSNPTRMVQPLFLRMDSGLGGTQTGYADQHDIEGYPLYLSASGSDGKTENTKFITDIKPGQTRSFTFACAVAKSRTLADTNLKRTLATVDPLRAQRTQYQGWFDHNIAYFTCSDPLVSKMYYHRWYNIKKNSMDPQLGKLQHKTFAEGRWTADWYANVISYGAGHQIRESRWLRDGSYAWGHVQTWAENPRPDGIFPSHITPKGQQGGQYTDWIASTAWDTYLVHPDNGILARVADPLARNAEGWRKVYGWGDTPLLVVDSHWWTGMEWQPSFFSFAGYKTGGGVGTDPARMTPLRRVDLAAYNFANAQNSAKIYRALGRRDDAARLQKLADTTREALLTQMWNPKTHWFHSLRASDNVPSPTKEIIALYPFSFDLPTRSQGYEAVWDVALDPTQFWTPWPLASVSKDCPAYAQNGWPVGPGGSGCMWNGPSWPHANSLVLTAMANTLRHYAPSALTRQKLLQLFNTFTRVQYKGRDRRYPWTGEYYNGDNGEWKTVQRDYNHSTWVDPLIHDLIGLVARPDNILEIDPLLPKGAWSYFVLDGQAYRGHDVSIAYDAQGGHVAPGFQGFAVYLDGKPIYHSHRPTRFTYDMAAHRLVALRP